VTTLFVTKEKKMEWNGYILRMQKDNYENKNCISIGRKMREQGVEKEIYRHLKALII
jgi:hypothetical protein